MLSCEVIDALWISMADQYGPRWTSSYGIDPANGAGRTWAMGLAGLTHKQVSRGVHACAVRSDPWPPSMSEFRAMCIGIPSLAAVRVELRSGAAQISAFTRAVWTELDVFRYRHSSADQAERLLRDTYELVRERTMRGVPLPEEPVASIEHQREVAKPATPEQARSRFLEIKELLKPGTH